MSEQQVLVKTTQPPQKQKHQYGPTKGSACWGHHLLRFPDIVEDDIDMMNNGNKYVNVMDILKGNVKVKLGVMEDIIR